MLESRFRQLSGATMVEIRRINSSWLAIDDVANSEREYVRTTISSLAQGAVFLQHSPSLSQVGLLVANVLLLGTKLALATDLSYSGFALASVVANPDCLSD